MHTLENHIEHLSQNFEEVIAIMVDLWKRTDFPEESSVLCYEKFVSQYFSSTPQECSAAGVYLMQIFQNEKTSYVQEHGVLTIISCIIEYWEHYLSQCTEAEIGIGTKKIEELLKVLAYIGISDLALFYSGMLFQKMYTNPVLRAWEKEHMTVKTLLQEQENYQSNKRITEQTQYFSKQKIIPLITASIASQSPSCETVVEDHSCSHVKVKHEKKDIYQFSQEHKAILDTYSPALVTFLKDPRVSGYLEDNPRHIPSFTTTLLLNKSSWESKITQKFPYFKKIIAEILK